MQFQELSSDQRRELVNTQQRYAAYREVQERANAYRGSMVWTKLKGREYLVRSAYTKSGLRRQTSLGLRSKETEAIKQEFDRGRAEAQSRLRNLKDVIARQSAVNRVLGLGRIPLIGAKIIRALDQAAMLGSGIRSWGCGWLTGWLRKKAGHFSLMILTGPLPTQPAFRPTFFFFNTHLGPMANTIPSSNPLPSLLVSPHLALKSSPAHTMRGTSSSPPPRPTGHSDITSTKSTKTHVKWKSGDNITSSG